MPALCRCAPSTPARLEPARFIGGMTREGGGRLHHRLGRRLLGRGRRDPRRLSLRPAGGSAIRAAGSSSTCSSVVLPIPLVAFMLTTDSLAAFYWVNPLAHMFGVGLGRRGGGDAAGPGAAADARHRRRDLHSRHDDGRPGARALFRRQDVGVCRRACATGIFALYVMPPLTLLGLWIGIAPHRRARGEQGRAGARSG